MKLGQLIEYNKTNETCHVPVLSMRYGRAQELIKPGILEYSWQIFRLKETLNCIIKKGKFLISSVISNFFKKNTLVFKLIYVCSFSLTTHTETVDKFCIQKL